MSRCGNWDCDTRGLPQIVVERSEYTDGAGQVWNLGGASLALKLQ